MKSFSGIGLVRPVTAAFRISLLILFEIISADTNSSTPFTDASCTPTPSPTYSLMNSAGSGASTVFVVYFTLILIKMSGRFGSDAKKLYESAGIQCRVSLK